MKSLTNKQRKRLGCPGCVHYGIKAGCNGKPLTCLNPEENRIINGVCQSKQEHSQAFKALVTLAMIGAMVSGE